MTTHRNVLARFCQQVHSFSHIWAHPTNPVE